MFVGFGGKEGVGLRFPKAHFPSPHDSSFSISFSDGLNDPEKPSIANLKP